MTTKKKTTAELLRDFELSDSLLSPGQAHAVLEAWDDATDKELGEVQSRAVTFQCFPIESQQAQFISDVLELDSDAKILTATDTAHKDGHFLVAVKMSEAR